MDDRVGLDVCVDAVDLRTDYLEPCRPMLCVVTGDVEEAEIVDGYAVAPGRCWGRWCPWDAVVCDV